MKKNSTEIDEIIEYINLQNMTDEELSELIDEMGLKRIFTAAYELTAFITGRRPLEHGDAEFDEIFESLCEIIYERLDEEETLEDGLWSSAYTITSCFTQTCPSKVGEDPEFDKKCNCFYMLLSAFYGEE